MINNRFFSDLLSIPVMQSFKLPNYIQKLTKIEQWGVQEGPERPKPKADAFTLCYSCSCAGDSLGKKMTQCHQCKDWYHYDCVTPPIIVEPSNWICPKHAQHDMAERYYTQIPEFNQPDLIPVMKRPENAAAMESFGITQPLCLPGEAIKNQFISKIRQENSEVQFQSNQDLAKHYLKSIEEFAENAIKTVKTRFCLDDESFENAFRKIEDLKAIIEVF